jgi:hypothetical protein
MTVVWYDDKRKHEQTAPTAFPVMVLPDGSVTVLKMRMMIEQKVRARYGCNRGETFTIPQTVWKIPGFFHEWAHFHKCDAATYLSWLFRALSLDFEFASFNSMIRVTATRNNMSAVFSINERDTRYFFADRDVMTNQKKVIFHVVKAFARKSGTAVRLHFRGERDFDWNGYRIHISVPGLHHNDPAGFDVAAIDAEPDDPTRLLTMAEFGRDMADHLGKTREELRDFRKRTRA